MKKKHNISRQSRARLPGLWQKCNRCQTWVWDICAADKGPISRCEHKDDLQYIAALTVPGEKRRIVRVLGKEYEKSLEQFAILKQQLKNGLIETEDKPVASAHSQKQTKQEEPQPTLLIHCMALYMAYLKNEGIPSHLVRHRDKLYIRDIENGLKLFCRALKKAGYDINQFKLSDLSHHAVGVFHDLLIAKKYSPRSYNKFLSFLTSFITYLQKEGFDIKVNHFERAPRKAVMYAPEAITKQEFQALLAAIKPEDGLQYNVGKKKETRNHYREFLPVFFRFSLLTGRRMEECLSARFSDIKADEEGNPVYIGFTDFKVSRILNMQDNHKMVYTPVTRELSALLDELGYREHKGTDRFLIAPDYTKNRIAQLRIVVSRSFSHYWKKAFPDSERQLTLKCLRKTYLTSLSMSMNGGDVRSVSGHSSTQVVDRHYLDPKQRAIAASLRDFSVFGDDEPKKKVGRSKGKNDKSLSR